MLSATIVVERPQDCPWPLGGHRIVAMDDYASNPRIVPVDTRVVNLCRNGGYLARSYDCSLLAEARGHAVLPSVATLAGLNCRTLHGPTLDRLNRALTILLKDHPPVSDRHRSILVVFGRAADPCLQPLAALAFDLFPCPLLTIDLDGRSRRVTGLRLATGRSVEAESGALFRDSLEAWLSTGRPPSARSPDPWPYAELPGDSGDPRPAPSPDVNS